MRFLIPRKNYAIQNLSKWDGSNQPNQLTWIPTITHPQLFNEPFSYFQSPCQLGFRAEYVLDRLCQM